MKHLLTLGAASAAMLLAAPANAAPVAADPPAEAEALILIPLTLTKLRDLHFGTIIPAAVSGTVTVPANGAAPTVTGGLTLIASDPPTRARFGGAGSGNQNVVISASNPGTLGNGLGDTVTVLALTMDSGPVITIDPTTRAFIFHVGGVLQVGANQPEGLYSAEFDVTADYL